MSDNFEDYDFTPSTSSNLASLFDNSPLSSASSTLIYTAPKQPKTVSPSTNAKQETAAPVSDSSVIATSIVFLWKLNASQYVPEGKFGLAIIGSSSQNSYELILYKDRRNVTTRVNVSKYLEISLKKDNFVAFYDNKDNWLIKFNSADDCTSTLKKLETYGAKILTVIDKNESVGSAEDSTPLEKNEILNVAKDDVTKFDDNKVRADILSRISKMGHSIFPCKTVEEDSVNIVNDEQSATVVKNNQCIVSSSSNIRTVAEVPTKIHTISSTFVRGQPMPQDSLQLYFAENNIHNTEVRINLSQMSEKLNSIMKALDNEKPHKNSSDDTLKSRNKVLDLRIENLMKELTFHQNENAKLKSQLHEQENELKVAEQMKMDLATKTEQEAAKIAVFEEEINRYKSKATELANIVEERKLEMEDLRGNVKSQQESANTVSKFEKTILDLNAKIKEREERQQEKNSNIVASLKDAMNEMYSNIMTNFNEGQQYESTEIHSIIAKNIRTATVKIIQSFQQMHNTQ